MKVYYCENSVKGNQYVGADNIGHAIRIFVKKMGEEPNIVTLATSELLLEKPVQKFELISVDKDKGFNQ